MTRECSITVDGKDSEDILFGIRLYTSSPKEVKKLTDEILDVALAGKGKLYFVTVNIYDYMAAEKETYRNSLPAVNEAYKRCEQALLQKFREHPEVRALLDENKVLVISFVTTVICELESKHVNKVIVYAGNYDLERIINSLNFFSNKLIEQEIATRILGYDLWGDPKKMRIDELYVEGKKVYLWLG